MRETAFGEEWPVAAVAAVDSAGIRPSPGDRDCSPSRAPMVVIVAAGAAAPGGRGRLSTRDRRRAPHGPAADCDCSQEIKKDAPLLRRGRLQPEQQEECGPMTLLAASPIGRWRANQRPKFSPLAFLPFKARFSAEKTGELVAKALAERESLPRARQRAAGGIRATVSFCVCGFAWCGCGCGLLFSFRLPTCQSAQREISRAAVST